MLRPLDAGGIRESAQIGVVDGMAGPALLLRGFAYVRERVGTRWRG